METLSYQVLLLLSFLAFIAGVIDTLAGGGGLITVPALMMSGLNPVLALGTNKLQSSISEISATLHFAKSGKIGLKKMTPYLVLTGIGACCGGILLQFIKTKTLESMIPFLLLGVFIYYLFSHSPKKQTNLSETQLRPLVFLGPLVGFYNGFFGPGTGSIWSIVLMRFTGLGIKEATMYTKPLNFVGNLASLIIFLLSGKIYFFGAMCMGIGSFMGGKVGAILLIYKNSTVIRHIFIFMMVVSLTCLFKKYYF